MSNKAKDATEAMSVIVPLSSLVADPAKNCRASLEPMAGDEDADTKGGQTIQKLADDIKKEGQITPIVVRKDGDKYEVIDGYRRAAALELLGRTTAKVQVMDVDDVGAALLNAKLNLIRKDLTPYETAITCHKFMSKFGWTGEKTAKELGFSGRKYVTNLARIVEKVHPKVLEQWKLGNGLCTVAKLLVWANFDNKKATLEAFEKETDGKDVEIDSEGKPKKNGHKGEAPQKVRAETIEKALEFFSSYDGADEEWLSGVQEALAWVLGQGDGKLGAFDPVEFRKREIEARKEKRKADKASEKAAKEMQE